MIYLHNDNFIFEHKISTTSNRHSFLNHMHNEWELYYFIEGKVEFFIDGMIYHLSPGDLFLIPPATFHFAKPAKNITYERIVIDFPDNTLPQLVKDSLKDTALFYNIAENQPLQTLLINISSAVATYPKEEALLILENLLHVALLQLKHISSPAENTSTQVINELLKDIIDYIDDNITTQLSLENIAKQFFISVSTLSHSFKKYTNITVKQYINYKKILYAQNLIRSGFNTTETFVQIGFNNYSTFFRLYKKYLGSSPEIDKPMKNKKSQ